jgi:hypothetical protein
MEKFLSTNAACKVLRVDRTALWKWSKRGCPLPRPIRLKQFPGSRGMQMRLWSRDDIEALRKWAEAHARGRGRPSKASRAEVPSLKPFAGRRSKARRPLAAQVAALLARNPSFQEFTNRIHINIATNFPAATNSLIAAKLADSIGQILSGAVTGREQLEKFTSSAPPN